MEGASAGDITPDTLAAYVRCALPDVGARNGCAEAMLERLRGRPSRARGLLPARRGAVPLPKGKLRAVVVTQIGRVAAANLSVRSPPRLRSPQAAGLSV
jgi:hypothetical protein